jgi:hypothetical protein
MTSGEADGVAASPRVVDEPEGDPRGSPAIAAAEARGADRAMARIKAILTSPEAQGPCQTLAIKLAISPDIPADEAIALLSAAQPAPTRTGKLH